MAGDDEPQQPSPAPQQSGARRLDGTFVPSTASSSSAQPSSSRQPTQPPKRGVAGLRTLKDLQNQGGDGHGHSHGDDGSDEENENQDFFAGGEKSGLAVQDPSQAANPRDHINNIIKRARQ
jgi:UBX domain-containing protein 1